MGAFTWAGNNALRLNGSTDSTINQGTLTLAHADTDNDDSTVTLAADAVLALAFDGADTVNQLWISSGGSNLAPAHLILEYSNDLNAADPRHPVDLAGPSGDIGVSVIPGSPNADVTVKIPTSHASAAGSLFARLKASES